MIVGHEKPSFGDLAHHGVKGMHWGVRNNDESGSNNSRVVAEPTVDSHLHPATQAAGKEVAALIGSRYDFHIGAVKTLDPTVEAQNPGLMGYVLNTPGKAENTIYASRHDIRKPLKDAENTGWFAKDCGNPKAFMTHEVAHAMFHSEQQVKSGLLGAKVIGGNRKARDKALKAALKEAKREGISPSQMVSKISGYATAANSREEAEAELFSQYHWSSNPPKFVQAWGKTLHHELGIDDTPFREVRG